MNFPQHKCYCRRQICLQPRPPCLDATGNEMQFNLKQKPILENIDAISKLLYIHTLLFAKSALNAKHSPSYDKRQVTYICWCINYVCANHKPSSENAYMDN